MTQSSGSEIGQVFVRVNASGDALVFLKQVKDKITELTRLKGASGAVETKAFDTTPIVAANQQLAMSLEQVTQAAQKATQEQAQSIPVAQRVEQATQKAIQTSNKYTIVTKQKGDVEADMRLIQSQNAAAAGDFALALSLATDAVSDAHEDSMDYQVALKNLLMIQQQAATQSRTLGRAVAEGGASMAKLGSETKKGAERIEAAMDLILAANLEYEQSIKRLEQLNTGHTADQKQMIMLNSTLARTFEMVAVKAMNEERALNGVESALMMGKTAISQYRNILDSLGMGMQGVEAHVARLQTALDRQNKRTEAQLERQRVRTAQQAVDQSKINARFNGTENALMNLNTALQQVNGSSRATQIITQQIIRLEGDRADALNKAAIATARAYERTRDYSQALSVLRTRQQEVRTPGRPAGSLASQQELTSMIDRMEIQQANFGRDWWNGPIGQLRNFSGTVLAITGAFYTLRDAVMTTFQALQTGAQLAVTESQMRLLVTSTEEYNKVLEAASQNIQLFGGTLQSTLADMNRLVILSNQTGASVELLNQAVLLLSTKDPQQGAAGAVIALNEALAEGQTVSLRRRFELVGSSIGYFTDETMSSNEKIQRLITTLSNMGISMDLLERSVGDAARTVNELGAVSEETWARIGQALSVSLADELKVLTNALKDANASLAEYARTNDQINEAKTVGFTEDQMKVLTDGTMGLTGAQRLAMAEAMKTADAQTKLAKELELTSEAFLQAGANAEAYRQRLEPLIKAVEEKNAAAIEYIKSTLQSAETEARQAEIMRDLVDLSTKVADGHMTAADASKALEEKYGSLGLSVSALQGMFVALAAQSRETASGLAADAATAAAAWQRQMSEVVRAAQLIGKEGAEAARIRLQQLREDQALVLPGYENAPERGRIAVDIKQAELDLQREINRETKAAEDLAVDWAVATGNVVPELERARKEYARIMSTASSATKEEKQRALELAQIIRTLEGALEGAKPSGGGGGGAARLSDQDKLNNQLALDQLKANQQAQDALIAHEDRMLEIRKDYAERTLRAIEEYQEDQKSGRASFYESLTGVEDHGLQKAMSAQFEAAALEAGKIAQTLGPDVAAQFLQQMQKNITDQAKRQQEISKALDKGSDDFNPALAEYLQGVDQLFRVSEQGAINQILRARDSLAMSEQGAIQDAEQKYIDALAKISDTAAESAERRIEAVRLAGKEIDLEIAKVQELGATYEKIGFTPGSQRTVALQGNAPDPMAGVSESLAAIAGDITSVLNAIRSNTGDTASAVRRLSPSVTQ